jgi:hypothetical protein
MNDTFADYSGLAHSFSTAAGSPTINTVTQKFGVGSGYFPGPGISAAVTTADSTDWYFSTGKVSVGAWVDTSNPATEHQMIAMQGDGSNQWAFIIGNGKLLFYNY